MIEVAEAINSFLPAEQEADIVSPSEEEPVFILTSSQLQDIITKAVEKATQPLQREISRLNQRIDSLESLHDQDVSRICLDIAYDRQRLARLEKVEPQPLQKDRGEILRALIAANGGKMLAKDARQKMHLIKPRFSELLATMKDDIEIKPYHLRKNQKVLVLR
jgi:hypothetical protein